MENTLFLAVIQSTFSKQESLGLFTMVSLSLLF